MNFFVYVQKIQHVLKGIMVSIQSSYPTDQIYNTHVNKGRESFLQHCSSLFPWCQMGREYWCLENAWWIRRETWYLYRFVYNICRWWWLITKLVAINSKVGDCWHYEKCVILDGNLLNKYVNMMVAGWVFRLIHLNIHLEIGEW